MKRILITGANSYIGTSVEKYLAQWPEEYQVDTIDMVDGSWREKSFASYDSVFHVAGIAHQDSGKITEERKQLYYKVNTDLTIETAKKAKAEGVGQFIFMSSIIVYGASAKMGEKKVITRDTVPAPVGAYGDSKLQAEKGIEPLNDDNFKVCILRPPMIYGPGSKGNYPLLEKAALKLPFFPDIENERSMLHIDGLCVYVKAMIDSQASGIHFPQNPEYVCTSQMVRDIATGKGKRIRLISFFNPILRLFSGRISVLDKVFGNLTIEREFANDYIPDMVSVIMPAYNASAFIEQAIRSVLSQTYKSLELIIVDDCSNDETVSIVEGIQVEDHRIRLIKQDHNSGAGNSRNLAVKQANGEFLAFIDSDDLWVSTKLHEQIAFMRSNGYTFTCTDYNTINENGQNLGELRRSLPVTDYDTLLKHCPGNSTVIYNSGKLGKVLIPPIRKRNDYVMWLRVIKRAGLLHGMPETLSQYRIHSGGISSKKTKLIRYHWEVYREIEELPLWRSIYLMAFWSLRTITKKIYRK